MSITTSAMIVTLTVHCWTARKQDKKVAKEVDDRHGAKDAGRYNKLLIDKAHIQPLQSLANSIRDEHYKMTLPWMDSGGRLLPSKLFMDWRDRMEGLREQYRQAVDKFVDRYEASLVPEARQRLGTLYNPADYPRGDDVRAKFGVSHDFMPVPSANAAAEVLARAVACSLELPFERLVRSRWATRFAPPEEHFTVRARQVPTSVLLVDDLVRTGASMRGCAARLRRRGVVDVWGIAAAADLDLGSADTATSLALRELELDAS